MATTEATNEPVELTLSYSKKVKLDQETMVLGFKLCQLNLRSALNCYLKRVSYILPCVVA